MSQLYQWHTWFVGAFLVFVMGFVALSWRRR
jgi:hypothetical protein